MAISNTPKDPTLTALDRPWTTIWEDEAHDRNSFTLPQGHHNKTLPPPGGLPSRPPITNGHPPRSRGNVIPKPLRKAKVPYALESYLNQSIREEPWNNVSGFYPRGGGGAS